MVKLDPEERKTRDKESLKRRRQGRDEQLFGEPAASVLERYRDKARLKRRIIYDCFKAEVIDRRVRCGAGHKFQDATDGTILLITVLRGRTPRVCQECIDYDDGDEPGG